MLLQVGYYLLSVLGIIRKKSKIITVLMLFVMWLVFGLCTYNGDYNNYMWIYQNIQNPYYWTEFEPLFNLLMFLCSVLGLSFIQFRMVFAGIFVILLFITIGKYTNYKAEAIGLYMIFPFLTFTSIIRSGLAGVLVVLAFHEVIAENKNKKKFWVLMVMAILIQYTSVLFVIFYLLRKKGFKRNSVIIVIGLLGIAFATYYSGIIYKLVSTITSSYRVLKWFMPSHSVQEPRWILYLVIIAFMVVFLANLSRRENTRQTGVMCEPNEYAEDIYYFNIAMLIFIPTFFVTNASARLMWEVLLFNIICYAKDDEIRSSNNSIGYLHINPKTIIMILFLLFFMVYSNLPYRGTADDLFLVFHNNLMIGG